MDHSASFSSRLFYRGTQIEVRLGDRVEMKRFLRSPLIGHVCYLPGISPVHPELEYEQWAIKSLDGTVYAIGYFPEQFQVPRGIRFVCRTDTPGIDEHEPLN
jgi:hypothetical protein